MRSDGETAANLPPCLCLTPTAMTGPPYSNSFIGQPSNAALPPARKRAAATRLRHQPLTCSHAWPTLTWPPVTIFQPTAQVVPSPRPLPAATG